MPTIGSSQEIENSMNEAFYDSWIKRDEAIFLSQNRHQAEVLREFFVEKLKNDEEIENDEFRLQIHIDFNLEVLRFCLNSGFSAEQTSTFLSILNTVFRESLKRKMTTDLSYETLEKIIAQYLFQTPPFSVKIFGHQDRSNILTFVGQLYKFFQMYEISMTKFIDFNIITQELYLPFPREEELDTGHEIGTWRLTSC